VRTTSTTQRDVTLSARPAGAVLTPRPARRKNLLPVPPALAAAHEAERQAHATKRIRVEHDISHLKNWRALSRHLGRREHLDPSCPRSPDSSPVRNEHCELPSSTANRKLYRPTLPADRTRPDQVNDRPPPTMHEV
jgi:hypothetical protein